ncbi:MAG TPA: T9SS type A sorting domain-containing protein, partial [Saprospiraceae bacterium]|nr:T9SS type A sorting domain-containing protein [Saprospiraceae bacterium]
GFGVWEAELFEPSSVIAQPIASALETNCARDTIYFDDYSVVKHEANTAWAWAFSPAPQFVSATDVRNPKVVFGAPGTYTATMTLNGQHTNTLSISVSNGCAADTIADRAVSLGGNANTGYIALPRLGINTNTVTFSAWVKPDGIQPDYSAIFMHDGDAAGFNFLPGNNHIGYHWPNGAWWWDSGLTATPGEWSHVAMVVTPDSISIYLNGRRSTHAFSVPLMNFSETARLGNYRGWGGRYMKGSIEEVCIFDKSLSQSEVRELMHLTKKPADQLNLLAYYQFNEASGRVLDRVGTRHAALVGSATRITSSAPVGGGTSKRLTITSGGVYDFASPGLVLGFPASGPYPNGELCVSRLNVPPDQLPNADPHSVAYWVVHNYGTNATFAPLDSLRFSRIGNIEVGADPAGYHLWKRGSTAHGNTWGNIVDDAERVVYSTTGSGEATFAKGNDQTGFSQFIITRSTGPLPVEWLDFRAALQDDGSVRLYWSVNQTAEASHFVVEKSRDGLIYSPIGQVTAQPGSGLLRYEDSDAQPFTGLNYYRLRQYDRDGSTSLSPVRIVVLQAAAQAWSVYPSPLSANQTLRIVAATEGTYRFRLYEASGKMICDRSFSGSVELPQLRLAAGVYAYEILSDAQRATGRVVVE